MASRNTAQRVVNLAATRRRVATREQLIAKVKRQRTLAIEASRAVIAQYDALLRRLRREQTHRVSDRRRRCDRDGA